MNKFIENQMQVFDGADAIVIDTCSLMSDSIKDMLKRMEAPLLIANKKIYVPRAVVAELYKHLEKGDVVRQESATRALDAMWTYRSIIDYEYDDLTHDEIMGAFADPEIFSYLQLNRINKNQILITNDSNLATDVNMLNGQKSCNGREITVLRLSNSGFLWKNELNKEEPAYEVREVVVEKPVIKMVEKTDTSKLLLIGSVAVVVGAGLGKYGGKIIKALGKIA